MPAAAPSLTVDTRDVAATQRALDQVGRALDDEMNTRLRTAYAQTSQALLGDLRISAGRSRTPQAAIVAAAMRIRRDSVVGVEIGGGQPVGSRGTPAGVLVSGSEYGGVNFDAPKGSGYWIRPAVEAFQGGKATQPTILALNQITRDAGL